MTTPRNERFVLVEQKQPAQQTRSRNAAPKKTKNEPNADAEMFTSERDRGKLSARVMETFLEMAIDRVQLKTELAIRKPTCFHECKHCIHSRNAGGVICERTQRGIRRQSGGGGVNHHVHDI